MIFFFFLNFEKNLEKSMRQMGTVTVRTQYHCQFFGKTAERSWISSKAILPWEENMTVQDQFFHLTKQIRAMMGKSAKKASSRIKSEVSVKNPL